MIGQDPSAKIKEVVDVGVTVDSEDQARWRWDWLCEKWSEDAVEFCQRKLERDGVTHIQDGNERAYTGELTWDNIAQEDVPKYVIVPRMVPIRHGITSDILRELVGEPEESVEIQGNLLLNEGIQRAWDLIIAAVSNQTAANAYGNTNAYVGIGDSSTAEAATQTELQAATNRFYKIMNATYPIRTAQSVDFRSDFISSEANYVWNEWTVAAGATVASGGGFTSGTTNLNRKVQSLGTKATGTWTMTGTVTIS